MTQHDDKVRLRHMLDYSNVQQDLPPLIERLQAILEGSQ